MLTYDEWPFHGSHNLSARKEKVDSPFQPSAVKIFVPCPVIWSLVLSVPDSMIPSQKNQKRSQSTRSNRPPETNRPVHFLHNKASKRRTADCANHVDGRVDGEGLAPLVERVHVDDDARRQHLGVGGKDASDGSRSDERVVVGRPIRESRPDGSYRNGNHAPEGTGHGAKDADERDEQHGADNDAC